jgi:epoxyqueuosine reductase
MIKAEACRLGFDGCGIARATCLVEETARLRYWLRKGYQGSMTYMENHTEKRSDPEKLVDGVKSVISVILNYYTNKSQADPEAPVLSKYAYGKDYHNVILKKLRQLQRYIHQFVTPVDGRASADSAPVFDKAWAARSGLGWIGKHTLLISPESGSFVFIGSLMVNIPLHYDKPLQDLCGDCDRCIRACPTQAIIAPRMLDARRCISYLTIEKKQEIDPGYKNKFANRVFGCDICQDVCPWNRKAIPHRVKEFEPLRGLLEMTRQEWYDLDETRYNQLFSNSAIKRAKFEGIRRNLEFIEK